MVSLQPRLGTRRLALDENNHHLWEIVATETSLKPEASALLPCDVWDRH